MRLVDHGQLCLRQRQRHFIAVPDVKDGPKAYRSDYLENIQPVNASTGVVPVCTQDPASQLVHMATHETHPTPTSDASSRTSGRRIVQGASSTTLRLPGYSRVPVACSYTCEYRNIHCDRSPSPLATRPVSTATTSF